MIIQIKQTKIEIQTQSTKQSSMSLGSTGRRPVINSNSMTPKEKTSDLSVSLPLDAYSGAKYLHCQGKPIELIPTFQVISDN